MTGNEYQKLAMRTNDGKPTMRQFGNKFKIECAQCGLQTKPDWKLTKAINLWNERKGD